LALGFLLEEHEGNTLLGGARHRWDDNIKMALHEVGLEGVEWIYVSQDRDKWWSVVNTVTNS
jgi:hypothetical protein